VRRTITTAATTVIVTSFVFSYGNITTLALAMGLPLLLALALAPAVDLTIVATVWGLRYASLSGIEGRRLRPARVLLVAAGLVTWGLNTAAAWSQRDVGKVALDSIAPALLLVWAELGPWFLRLFVEIRRRELAAHPTPAGPADAAGPARAGPPLASSRSRDRSASRSASRSSLRARGRRPGAPRTGTTPGNGARSGSGTSRRDEMVAFVVAEHATGREVSGAALDERFGTTDYGRRVLRELTSELASGNGHPTSHPGRGPDGSLDGHRGDHGKKVAP